MQSHASSDIRVRVIGVGGAGTNAVLRMAKSKLQGVELLALNTDIQALKRVKSLPTLAIGRNATRGMGAGGNPDLGRKAMRESQQEIADLLAGSDMVFVTAGMGGGTGTGAAPLVADVARRQGALTVGIVTRPFSFEGSQRQLVADRGLEMLAQKVDTLIAVDNDRLLTSLDGRVSLDKAFRLADEVLRQGVQGISDIIMVPGLINVDFADVKAVMGNGGPSFLALGEGKGKHAALEAVEAALANPLFDAPLEGASGVIFNIRAGKDLTLGQVDEVAGIIQRASKTDANVIFGVVQERRIFRRVSITLVATGISAPGTAAPQPGEAEESAPDRAHATPARVAKAGDNGHVVPSGLAASRLL